MRLPIAPVLMVAALGACGGGGGADDGPHTEFVLKGVVTYDDRIYGRASDQPGYRFVRTEAKPARFATVQVVNGSGRVVAEATVADTGDYTIAGAGGSRESMRLRVVARTRSGASVTVKDFAGNLLSVSKAFTPEALPERLNIAVQGEIAGAFNMLDLYAAAGEFVHEHGGEYPPALSVHWEPGNAPPGGTTYYCRSCGGGIYVLGGVTTSQGIAGDTDHFDDDVLLHEYGHFLEDRFGVLHSPGGAHTLTDEAQDLRLAWSEGFSSFMAGAIKSWMDARQHRALSSEGLPYSGYLDTADGQAGPSGGFYFDFGTTQRRYASSEAAVTKVLWNLHATDAGMDDIWAVFSEDFAAASATHPASLETFWDAWQASTSVASPLAVAVNALAERHIHYSTDVHETDDTLLLARGSYQVAEDHNLFKSHLAPETDLIPFDAVAGVAYRIETYNLVNGAHTFMRVTDANGIALAVERTKAPASGRNDGCALASRIDAFTPPYTGRFFVEVTRPSATRPFAGRYGGYQVSIVALTPSAPAAACP
ncbi:MAG: hypothetical protein AB7U81_12155 [Thiohalomonadaceae bacterium]